MAEKWAADSELPRHDGEDEEKVLRGRGSKVRLSQSGSGIEIKGKEGWRREEKEGRRAPRQMAAGDKERGSNPSSNDTGTTIGWSYYYRVCGEEGTKAPPNPGNDLPASSRLPGIERAEQPLRGLLGGNQTSNAVEAQIVDVSLPSNTTRDGAVTRKQKLEHLPEPILLAFHHSLRREIKLRSHWWSGGPLDTDDGQHRISWSWGGGRSAKGFGRVRR